MGEKLICALEACTFSGLGTSFPHKLDRECSRPWSEIKTPVNYILAIRCAPMCKLGPLL